MRAVRLLAIDTSTDVLSVACGDGFEFVVREERLGPAHAERVLPRITEVLAQAGWTLASLDSIAFGAGPGAFTGVRIACGVAQGLGMGADRPLVPVGTLAALAQEAWRMHAVSRVWACLDARMREVYLADCRREDDSGWRCLRGPDVLKPDDIETAPGDAFGAGDGYAAHPALVSRLAPGRCDPALRPTARALGELARLEVLGGLAVAANAAHPQYVRHRIALTSAERAAGATL